MESRKRIIVVGLGSIGRRHARLLKERNDLVVEGCEADPRAVAAANEQIGALPVYPSFQSALTSRPYAMVIATPHSLHAEQAIAALAGGVHALCEKPMSDTLQGAETMKAAADKSAAILNIGFHLHFHPGARKLKALVRGGALGRVLHAHCRVGSYITLVNSASRYQATLEGALLLDYAHQPDLLYWLLEASPTTVQMSAVRGGNLEHSSNPNLLALTCEYADPMISTVHLNYVQAPERHEYEIVGDEGWAIWDAGGSFIRIGRRKDSREERIELAVDRDAVYRAEHESFLGAAEGRNRPETSAADGLVSLRVIEAALRSWKSGAREKVRA